MSDGDVAWMKNLEFVFVKDGDVTTVTGLTYREKGRMDVGDAVGQGCFRRKRQGEVSFGGSSHGAFVRGGDFYTADGQLLIEEVEDQSARLMVVHPVSAMMQLSSLARSWKGLELDTEGGELQV